VHFVDTTPNQRRRCVMTNKPAERRAQEPSDNTSQNPAVEVGDGATRYDWSIAFSRMCMRKEYPAIAIAAAMRLVEYPARGTGQCDAKRITIANELGVSERHLNRGLKVLKDDGWIRLQRGGPEDPVTITLLIPAEDVDIHHFGAKKIDGIQDTMMSRMAVSLTGQKRASYRTQTGVLQDTQCVPSKEQVEQIEQSAASPRAPEYVDIDGPVIPASISRARAGNGALKDLITKSYCALDDVYPWNSDNTNASKKIIAELINENADFGDILASAEVYCKLLSEHGGDTLPMDQWLRQRPWEKRNRPCQEEPASAATPRQEETVEKPRSRSSSSSSTTVPMKTTSSPVPQHTPDRSSAPARDRSPWPTGSVPVAGNNTDIDRLTLASS
jgi:hypothetical protein